jgi:hypothetical protein
MVGFLLEAYARRYGFRSECDDYIERHVSARLAGLSKRRMGLRHSSDPMFALVKGMSATRCRAAVGPQAKALLGLIETTLLPIRDGRRRGRAVRKATDQFPSTQ